MLTKRKDTPGLIRAYSQLGDLYFSFNQFPLSEECWNDALDNIFQKIHSLKSQKEINIEIGERNCLVACNILYKLARNVYYKNLFLQKEALGLAAILGFQVFKHQMANP